MQQAQRDASCQGYMPTAIRERNPVNTTMNKWSIKDESKKSSQKVIFFKQNVSQDGLNLVD